MLVHGLLELLPRRLRHLNNLTNVESNFHVPEALGVMDHKVEAVILAVYSFSPTPFLPRRLLESFRFFLKEKQGVVLEDQRLHL